MKSSHYSRLTFFLSAFVLMFAFASQTFAQTWEPPTDDAPGGNVPLPIHQGWNKQIKEGVFMTETLLLSGKLVASQQLCLASADALVETYSSGDTAGLDCVTSWDELTGGGGGGTTLPAGEDFQTLFYKPGVGWTGGSAIEYSVGAAASNSDDMISIGQPFGESQGSVNTASTVTSRARLINEMSTITNNSRIRLGSNGLEIAQGNVDDDIEIKGHNIRLKFFDGATTVNTAVNGDVTDPGYGSSVAGDILGLSDDGAGGLKLGYMPQPYIVDDQIYVWNEATDSYNFIDVGDLVAAGGGGGGGSGCSYALIYSPLVNSLVLNGTGGPTCTNSVIDLDETAMGGTMSATTAGSTLAWDSTTQQFVENKWLRTNNGENPFLHIGSAPSWAFAGDDGYSDNWATNPVQPANVYVYGSLNYRQSVDNTSTLGKILASSGDSGTMSWVDPAEYLEESINTVINTQTALDPGDTDGQFYWWNTDIDQWSLTNNIFASANQLNIVDGSVNIATGSTLTYVDNDSCLDGSDGYITRVKQRELLGSPLEGFYDVVCSNAIKIKNYGNPNYNEIVLSNVPLLTDPNFTLSQPRNLCYTSAEIPGAVEKNLLVDCNVQNSGNVTLFGPRFQGTGGSSTNLETQTNYDGYIGTLIEEYSDYYGMDFNYFKYEWEVPFGVTSVTIKGCAGGGGGGGGASSDPGISDKPGGGGGGGGGAGECTSTNGEVIDLSGVSKLVIKVGAGGRRGFGGREYVASFIQDYNVSSVNSSYNINGRAGSPVIVEKFNGSTSLGTPIQLAPGFQGSGGKKRNESNFSGFQNAGGIGGEGAQTPINDIEALFIGHNGTTGKDNESNTIEDIFAAIGYWTYFASTPSAGGNGGYGEQQTFPIPGGSVYGGYGSSGAGGVGSSATALSQGNASNLYGGGGGHGAWASGGGGGGGASGFDWADTCAFPAPSYQSVDEYTNSESDNCSGSNQGSTEQNHWFSKGGVGGHGGPGFVELSW